MVVLPSQVVGCLCPRGFSGRFCGKPTDVCRGQPCFRGVRCWSESEPSRFSCGECPDNTVTEGTQGYKCFEHGVQHAVVHTDALISHRDSSHSFLGLCASDMCSPPFPFPCHKDAVCRSTKQNYTCACKPGFTGDGHNCTGTDSQRQDAKHNTVAGPSSDLAALCVCRY